MTGHAYATPLDANAFEGEVVLTAPRGSTSIVLTPDAAELTATRLEAAARQARGQGPDSQEG